MISVAEIRAARVLIVGDRDSNRQLSSALGDAGYKHVSSTTNPLSASELNASKRFDLIVLDLQMAAEDGVAMIEALQADAAGDDLPVLVLVTRPEDRLRALRAGAKDFVNKPFDLVEISTRIHNILEAQLLCKRFEAAVAERIAEVLDNEARYRRLTELASDWYWEQDENGNFTRVYGPVFEMLGIAGESAARDGDGIDADGWNEAERALLRDNIAARRPFIDFVFTRTRGDGTQQRFQVSGEPMFDASSRFIGYRGVGIELMMNK